MEEWINRRSGAAETRRVVSGYHVRFSNSVCLGSSAALCRSASLLILRLPCCWCSGLEVKPAVTRRRPRGDVVALRRHLRH